MIHQSHKKSIHRYDSRDIPVEEYILPLSISRLPLPPVPGLNGKRDFLGMYSGGGCGLLGVMAASSCGHGLCCLPLLAFGGASVGGLTGQQVGKCADTRGDRIYEQEKIARHRAWRRGQQNEARKVGCPVFSVVCRSAFLWRCFCGVNTTESFRFFSRSFAGVRSKRK